MSVGVIGGSDGPTAIFVSSGSGWFFAAAALCLVIAIIAVRRFVKRKRGQRP